jgi:hypothetical protein
MDILNERKNPLKTDIILGDSLKGNNKEKHSEGDTARAKKRMKKKKQRQA